MATKSIKESSRIDKKNRLKQIWLEVVQKTEVAGGVVATPNPLMNWSGSGRVVGKPSFTKISEE